ncbi:MAG: tetratricopeptide repeat protein, partial [Candidatus Coatesbacteria bacterium]|nr:tetratricopeptide repeat protein [Candidatus Coatesbacteria bacterium]
MDLTPNAATRMEKNFVDRQEYLSIFDNEFNNVDNNSSRVLVLYGQPGIGKTALSIKLRQHCNTNEQAPVVARYSFKDGYQGKLNVLDTLANDICTDTNSYNMYYYYLAQTVYYALQKRRPENPRIPDKYCNLLSKLPFLGLAVDLFTAITNYAWEELKIFLSKEKTVFRGFLQSLKRDQIIDNLPRYFACNLADETKEGRKAVVILDTMDKVPDNDDDNRKWLRTLVNNAKGTLFVLTDRRELDWSGYTVAAPIRQEEVGELAEEDQRKLIKNVGIRQPEIVDAMVEGSCGVPFWLELCLDMYDNDQRNPEDYKGNRRELLDRFLNSMPVADKHTLERLACAVSFDHELFTTLVERFGTGFDNPEDRFQVFLLYRFLQPVSGKQGAPERYVIHDLLLRHIRDRLKEEEPTKWGETNEFILDYYYSIGKKLKDDGHYYTAEHYWELEKNQAEDFYGREDTRTATSYNNLAGLYRSQGRYAEAEDFYNKALEIDRSVYPDNHPEIATDMNNLALLYESQGRYAEAEDFYNKALEILKNAYEANHPYIATSYNNLAGLYESQERYAEAEDLNN